MNPELERLFQEKEKRRQRLAELSVKERFEMVEQLQDLALTMILARESLDSPSAHVGEEVDPEELAERKRKLLIKLAKQNRAEFLAAYGKTD